MHKHSRALNFRVVYHVLAVKERLFTVYRFGVEFNLAVFSEELGVAARRKGGRR